MALDQEFLYIERDVHMYIYIYIYIGFPFPQNKLSFIYNTCLIRHVQNRFKTFLYRLELSKY